MQLGNATAANKVDTDIKSTEHIEYKESIDRTLTVVYTGNDLFFIDNMQK